MEERRISILAFDRVQSMDILGPLEVFATADRIAGGGAYVTELLAGARGPVRTSSGARLLPDRAASSPGGPPPDTLIVALDGIEATTHRLWMDKLAEMGALPVQERVVERGKVVTAAGVSAGIDMALTLAARLAGDEAAKAIQLGIEYDPQPPFACGSPRTATPGLVSLVRTAADAAGRRPPGPPVPV